MPNLFQTPIASRVSRAALAMLMAAVLSPIPSLNAQTPDHDFAAPLAQTMIMDIQRNLSDLGYYAGPVSGDLNSGTAEAIRAAQAAAGAPVTGRAGPDVVNLLRFTSVPRHDGAALAANGRTGSPTADPTESVDTPAEARHGAVKSVPKGDPYVKAAQKQLKAMGLYDGKIDGLSGPKTRQALIDFRVEQGVKGPARLTPDLLARILSAKSSPETPAMSATPNPASASTTSPDTPVDRSVSGKTAPSETAPMGTDPSATDPSATGPSATGPGGSDLDRIVQDLPSFDSLTDAPRATQTARDDQSAPE